ncbi:MAG: helix-turn-helix domain-containing protein [Rhodospirillaceae bacterium]|nr:helix-turn-helix domain-containing protein [Rhodospirillaceae bacterium]MYB12389.1 helix-turn-helix domain-containing protein [Rhodospirillaceae bacterium]
MGTQPPLNRDSGDRTADPSGAPAVSRVETHVGMELREARERLGVSLKLAASALKIRDDYLAALERNDRAALPALPYAIGFVRSYATYVGLDPGELAQRFRDEAGDLPVGPQHTWLKPIEQGRISRSLMLVLSLVIAGAAYTAWYYRTADERKPAASADFATAPPTATRQVAEADAAAEPTRPAGDGVSAAPPADSPADSSGQQSADAAATVRDGETAALPDPPAHAAAPGPDDPARPGAGAGDSAPDAAAPDAAAPDNAAPDATAPDRERNPAAAPADGPIVLRALGLVWIRVRHPPTGRVVVEGIMKQGNEIEVPDDPGLVLDVGRANQLEYVVAGKSAGLAGPAETVRHNLSLDSVRLAAAARRSPPPEPAAGRAAAGQARGESSEAPPPAAARGLELRALGLVWIRVRHPQTRQVLIEGIMEKGNVVAVPDDPGLVLDVGRANQLEYLVRGKSAGLAGESPGPVHNLSLDPARLRRGG